MNEKVKNAIQDIYPDDYAHCYGCGRLNEHGYKLRTGWQGEKTVTYFTPSEYHSGGVPHYAYGGILASFIDCHSAGSASLYLHRKNGHIIGDGTEPPRFVTASLKVDYKAPTPLGMELKAVGTVKEIHPKRFQVITEVFAGEKLVVTGDVEVVTMPKSFAQKQ